MQLLDLKRTTETVGIESTNRMGLATGMESHFLKILTEHAYSDPLGSIVRESVSNSIDAMTASDKTDPVIVRLKEANGAYTLHFIDTGVGLSLEEFDQFIMTIGASNKRDSDKFLGGWGAGSKNFLSYCDSASYIIRKDGIERNIIIFKGEVFPERTVVYEKETTEPNGVEVIIPINEDDEYEVVTKIKEQCSYFDNVWYDIEDFNNTYHVYKTDLFMWNELEAFSEMHICLKGVAYPIDWKVLGINRLDIPIALRFDNYDHLHPSFNRESINYDKDSKIAILNKIKEVATFFFEQFNKNETTYPTLREAWSKINEKTKTVDLLDKTFTINELEKYSSVAPNNIKITGIEWLSPSFYKSNPNLLTCEYVITNYVKYNDRMCKAKNWDQDFFARPKSNYVLISDVTVSGFFREYLKKHYRYIVKEKWVLKNLSWFKKHLMLTNYPKKDWRNIIKEFQVVSEEFKWDLMEDGRKLHTSQEFLDFVKENKRVNPYKYGGKTLDKQKGQVTIGWIKEFERGSGYKVDKSVHDVDKLIFRHSTILFSPEDTELAKNFHDSFKRCYRWEFAVIGKNEFKKLPKNNKFMLFAKDSTERQSKVFRKAATTILFKRLLNDYKHFSSEGKDIIGEILKPLQENISKLSKYIADNEFTMNYEVQNMVYNKAVQDNDWDLTLWSEYKETEEALKALNFLKYFKNPSGGESLDYAKFINEELLIRKLSGRFNMDNFSICINEPMKVDENQLELQLEAIEENI